MKTKRTVKLTAIVAVLLGALILVGGCSSGTDPVGKSDGENNADGKSDDDLGRDGSGDDQEQ